MKQNEELQNRILYFLTCISILICMFLISKENLKQTLYNTWQQFATVIYCYQEKKEGYKEWKL